MDNLCAISELQIIRCEISQEYIENVKKTIEVERKMRENKKEREKLGLFSDALYSAIKGKGAFIRFKDILIRFGIEQKWYDFYEGVLSGIAISWCEDNDVKYLEGADKD